ncbi:MAG: DinB family protein [Armatimonas sp.]
MPLNTRIRSRLVDALAGTPIVVSTLLGNTPADSPLWDYRASPERFSLREVVAHLADYDIVWLEYLTAALSSSDGPAEVTAYEPDERAVKYDYAHAIPSESLAALSATRQQLVALLPALESTAWETNAIYSPRHGSRTVEELATQFLAHDGYHTRQIAEYLSSAPNAGTQPFPHA